jgi:hypothetical protein
MGDHKRSEWIETTAMVLILFGGLASVGGSIGIAARVGIGLPKDEGLLVMAIVGFVVFLVGIITLIASD